jgi:hypothetical protein
LTARPDPVNNYVLTDCLSQGAHPLSHVRGQAQFDLGLIPFLRNELTLATNPIKLYEYFSHGLPVVSTRLPEVGLFGDLVYLADDPESFAAQVERAAEETDQSLRERRIAIARQESWACRAEELLQALDRIGLG